MLLCGMLAIWVLIGRVHNDDIDVGVYGVRQYPYLFNTRNIVAKMYKWFFCTYSYTSI